MNPTCVTASRTPVHEIRCGSIRAVIWASADGDLHDVTVSRTDANGGDLNTFGRNDLLVLAGVLDDAHTWILRSAILAGCASSQAN